MSSCKELVTRLMMGSEETRTDRGVTYIHARDALRDSGIMLCTRVSRGSGVAGNGTAMGVTGGTSRAL